MRDETLEVGCYFDSARGIYIGEAVQNMAIGYGWSEKNFLSVNSTFYDEVTDEAIGWLNGNVAPEGTYFDFHDGEFFLMEEE
jgi:hypothetical protein